MPGDEWALRVGSIPTHPLAFSNLDWQPTEIKAMQQYIYCADVWCEDCGKAIRERIDAEGFRPDHPDDEETYDSGEYPKGPFPVDDEDAFWCGSGNECPNYVEPSATTTTGDDDDDENDDIDDMLDAYIGCALWSTMDGSTPNGGRPIDAEYGPDDIDAETAKVMREDCANFWRANLHHIRDGEFDDQASQAGHDFWLTRNEHGAGFWDGDWPESTGDALTEASKAFGEFNLYVGDDGKIHGN